MRVLQNAPERAVLGVAFGADSRTLAAGGGSGFSVWSLLNDYCRPVPFHATKTLYAFDLDPLGRWLYISDPWGGCSLYGLETGRWRKLPGNRYDHHVVSLSRTADGKRVAVSRGGAGTNHLECWDIDAAGGFTLGWAMRKWRPITDVSTFTPESSNGFTNGVAFSPDGRTLVTVENRTDRPAADNPVCVRSADSGELVAELGTFPVMVGFRVFFTPDGTMILGHEDRWLELGAVTGGCVGRLTPPGRAYFRAAAVHPSGGWLVTVGYDGAARLWELPSLRPARVFEWDVSRLHSVAFSPDGLLLAAGGDKGRVVVWDVDV
jgi:WD40 repeat protein